MSNQHFFIQGAMKSGKSYLLQHTLAQSGFKVGGFCVQRMYHGQQVYGYRIKDFDSSHICLDIEYDQHLSGIFITPEGKRLDVLENYLWSKVKEWQADDSIDYLLLDEIGGFELRSERFMTILYSLLLGKIPCVGVLKSIDNLAHTVKCHTPSSDYLKKHHQLQAFIEKHGKLLTMTEQNGFTIKADLQSFLNH